MHDRMQAAVRPREQPEQRAEGRECPAGERKGRLREFRRDTRKAAWQRIADDEQQERADAQRYERLGPGPRPPRHGVRGRDGTEHEERETRDVQGAMQRDSALRRDRRRITQGVERFADRRFLPEGQEGGPDAGADADDQPDEAQSRCGEHQRRIRLT